MAKEIIKIIKKNNFKPDPVVNRFSSFEIPLTEKAIKIKIKLYSCHLYGGV